MPVVPRPARARPFDDRYRKQSTAPAGGGYTGVGVSVGTTQPRRWVEGSPGSYRKTRTMFADHNDHTEHGSWLCLPGVDRKSIKRETFKDASPSIKNLVDATAGGHAV